MIEIVGNIWTFHDKKKWVAITTNGYIKSNGCAVMGAGVAAQCVNRYPSAPRLLGEFMNTMGNVVIPFYRQYRLVSFPVKHNWWEKVDTDLIEQSAYLLVEFVGDEGIEEIYLPRPGCGNGNLNWSTVFPILKPIFDDRFKIVELR